MVKTAESVPLRNGRVDTDSWLQALEPELGEETPLVGQALGLISGLPYRSDEFLEKGLELAALVRTLNMDAASLAAALLYRPVRTGAVTHETICEQVNEDVAGLVRAVARMADTSLLEMSNSRMQTSESRDQVENIKRMLVSMIDDARVAVLKLAERVVALRAAKASAEERRLRIGQEAHQVFAPLANRLGVWQLKWELEDLALRYLAPDIYKTIASQLDGRRAEREGEIEEIVQTMEARLKAQNIEAAVSGRAKHIFSIWRKMRAKSVGLDEVYDVRAIRVLVPDTAQCYAALGVIHTAWQHIPSEFDDYIAVPKENGYRSIHTAVSWSDGKTLEVQIRTQQMHEEAELGVCAHWAYKDDGAEDDSYARKMEWMRQVVEWQEEAEEHIRQNQIGLELGHRVREERIFVYTPKGHVLDLTTGATALDFAYRVHTEVGHRCRGARVDGRLVALNHPLESGQRVEVITAEEPAPSRTWLAQHLECMRTARAREKVIDWFKARSVDENVAAGSRLIEDMLQRLAEAPSSDEALERAARELAYEDSRALFEALGVGDCQLLDLLPLLIPRERLGLVPHEQTQLSLLEDFPVPNAPSAQSFSIELHATDRAGLLMDVTTFLGEHSITLLSNSGRIVPGTSEAVIRIEVSLPGLIELHALMDSLELIPAVDRVRRVAQGPD